MVDLIDEHRGELAPSARAIRDVAMMQIRMVLRVANRKVYGAHKLWKAAQRAGHDTAGSGRPTHESHGDRGDQSAAAQGISRRVRMLMRCVRQIW